MEIHSKQELKFFISADRMMNEGVFEFSLREKKGGSCSQIIGI